MNTSQAIPLILEKLYGKEKSQATAEDIYLLIQKYRDSIPCPSITGFSEKDVVLITYANQLQSPGKKPLSIFLEFCRKYLNDIISTIHFLPFFPYSSDDGFSVIDYRTINPNLGTWEDVSAFHPDFRLMFDFVCNHISSQSLWFQEFLAGNESYHGYFIEIEGHPDLSTVVRPRTLPLLHTFQTARGERTVWTTFSEDQIDLNYRNPHLLLEMLDILLFYCSKRAEIIRLDAIAYLWKELGTSCIHLPQTHAVIQLFRAVLDQVAPHASLITETNVAHRENISYFNNGEGEAQMVYNFALPPLILHTFHTQDSTHLTQWASHLTPPSDKVTFFNFLASHDGIGLNPAREILSEQQIDDLVQITQKNGGYVSYKSNPDGSRSPYELNINYFDALSIPHQDEDPSLKIARFLCAHAIMLSLQGLPAIYFHSLFGSRSWVEGVKTLGYPRAINRQKLDYATLVDDLVSKGSHRQQVFSKFVECLKNRAKFPALSPYSQQKILNLDTRLFANLRTTADGREKILCLHNITSSEINLKIDWKRYFSNIPQKDSVINLPPYGYMWIPGS